MAKYDQQLGNLKDQIQSSADIAIVLPANANVDKLASGLALALSLEKLGKKVSVITEATIKVSHTNLFGVDKLTSVLPQVSGGDLTITLGGVVAADGTVGALEKLDWYPQGTDLNLVFHVLPGQKFEPTKIEPHHGGSSFNLIFIIGSANLNDLGALYSSNSQVFQGATLVNIDTNLANTQFGKINIVDNTTSSTCEIVYELLPSLGLSIDADIATNILTGIFDATSNLTANVKPDTFMAIGQLMQAGGKVPGVNPQASVQPNLATQPTQATQVIQPAPVTIQGSTPLIDSNNLPQWLNFPTQPTQVPLPVSTPVPTQVIPPSITASQELPVGEAVQTTSGETDNPAPDWLTPKIFKGGSLE